MRFLGLVILMLSAQLASGQLDTLNITITEIPVGVKESPEYFQECEEERRNAIRDVQIGILKVENYGGISFGKRDFEFEEFYSNYLIFKYKIERIMTGCLTPRAKRCYFNEMHNAIFEKYGISIDDIRNIAEKEYEEFKVLDNEGRKRFIDVNYTYWRVDEMANYAAGAKDLQQKLKATVDLRKFDLRSYKPYGIPMEVITDETGKVVSCKVVSRDFPPDANEAIQKAVKEIGGWKPAILYGSKVKSKTWFNFIF